MPTSSTLPATYKYNILQSCTYSILLCLWVWGFLFGWLVVVLGEKGLEVFLCFGCVLFSAGKPVSYITIFKDGIQS